MRVLVTGADGYIGAVLCDLLSDQGRTVTGLDAGYYSDGWFGPPGKNALSPIVRRDIRDVTPSELTGIEAVVHLAELSNDPLAQQSPALTYTINHHASVRLARMAREAGVSRFVYTSSCSVYGADDGTIKTEQSAVAPLTPYAECKVLVERDVSEMADASFSPVFLRNATAFGPSPRMRFDLVLNNLAGWAWTTKTVRLMSDGSAWRPLVHVRDIARAVALTLEAPRPCIHNEIFNVGADDANYRVREIARMVHAAIPEAEVEFGARVTDNRSYRVAFGKIADRLGFACQSDAMSGARELAALFAAIGLTRQTFEWRSFTRLKQLDHLRGAGLLDAELFWTRQPQEASP